MEHELQAEEGAVEGDLYEVDESLSPLEAVLTYSRSELEPQRHAYIRGIGAVAQQIGESSDAGTTKSGVDGLDALLQLVQQLLATDGPWSDDPKLLVLTLEQLQPLVEALCATSKDPAHTQQQLHTLCDAVLHSLLGCCDVDEELAHQCVTSLASLLPLLPASEACTAASHYASSILADGNSLRRVLAIELLGQAAASGHLHAAGNEEASASKGMLRQVVVDLVTQVTESDDTDESAQQALLKHLGPLSALLPPAGSEVGPDADESPSSHSLILKVCTTLSSSTLWNVRAAVAAAIPPAIAYITKGMHCSVSNSTSADTTTVSTGPLQQQQPDHDGSAHTHRTAAPATSGDSSAAVPTPEDSSAALAALADSSAIAVVSRLCCLLQDSLGRDVSPWVRSAAIKAAGPALVQLPSEAEVPPSLLALYCGCVGGVRAQPPDVLRTAAAILAPVCQRCPTHTTNDKTALPIDHSTGLNSHQVMETSQQPANASNDTSSQQPATVGSDSTKQQLWATGQNPTSQQQANASNESTSQQLANAFVGLCSSGDAETVRHLVSGLPTVVRALGHTVAQQQLLAALMNLQPEGQKAVARQAMLHHIAALLGVLPVESFPDVLQFVLSEHLLEENMVAQRRAGGRMSEPGAQLSPSEDGSHVDRCGPWRDRLALAQQLDQLAHSILHAAPGLLRTTLLPCAVALCQDAVYAVRKAAAEQLGLILYQACSWVGQQGRDMGTGLACEQRISHVVLQVVLQLVGLGSHPSPVGGGQYPQEDHSCDLHGDIKPSVPCRISDLQLFAAACNGFIQAADDATATDTQHLLASMQQPLSELQRTSCASGGQCVVNGYHVAQQVAKLLQAYVSS